jgi:hypothetical protein
MCGNLLSYPLACTHQASLPQQSPLGTFTLAQSYPAAASGAGEPTTKASWGLAALQTGAAQLQWGWAQVRSDSAHAFGDYANRNSIVLLCERMLLS